MARHHLLRIAPALVGWGLLFGTPSAAAQAPAARTVVRADGAAGIGIDWTTAAASLSHEFGIGASRRLRLGYGGRVVVMTGRDIAFTTSSPSLIRAGLVDTIDVSRPRIAALNVTLQAGWLLSDRWRLGANIDVAGVSFGASRPAAARGAFAPPLPALDVAPVRTNLLLGGTRDRGSLASEFFAAFALSPSLELRAGLGHFVAEVESTPALPSGNARHRRFFDVAFIGFSRAWRRP